MPIPWEVIIPAAGSLLSSLLGAAGSSREAKKTKEYIEQQGQKLREALKPTVPFYETKAVPYLSNLFQKAILGNLGERLGQNLLSKWGIDLSDYLKVTGLDIPFSQTPIAQSFYGYRPQIPQSQLLNVGMPILREVLRRKYEGGIAL